MRKVSDVPRRAKKIRTLDFDEGGAVEKLVKFCQDRDEYIRRFGKRVRDYVEISPIDPLSVWKSDPDPFHCGDTRTKQERATAKGRRIENERRYGDRASSEKWNGAKRKK